MNENSIPTGAVVVGFDDSAHSRHAVDWAARQAALEARPLVLLHATSTLGTTRDVWLTEAGVNLAQLLEELTADAHTLMERTRDDVLDRHPGLAVTTVVRISDPRQALLDAADRASMLVLGSRGRGPVRSLLLGSVSIAVVDHATCPVIVVRPHHPGAVRRGVLVGVDGTELSGPTVEFAFRQAALHDLPLTVLHSYWDAVAATHGAAAVTRVEADDELERLRLAESVSGMGEEFPEVRVQTQLARGLPDDVLVRASDRMDLVVVGRHPGHLASRLVFGGIARSVVEHAATVVAVVPS